MNVVKKLCFLDVYKKRKRGIVFLLFYMAIKNNFKQILIDKIQGRKIKMRITKSSQEKNKKKNYKKVLQKVKRQIQGITLIALVVTIALNC